MRLPINNLLKSQIQYYDEDTAVDIHVPKGTPVIAAASGKVIYSEWGHTPWQTAPDTPNSILIKLDNPLILNGKAYYYHWYTHLSTLNYTIPDNGLSTMYIKEGAILGTTGLGNSVSHLHFGILSNRAQGPGDYMPPAQLHTYLVGLLRTVPAPEPSIETLLRTKIFYTKGKPLTAVVNGITSEPESLTFELITKANVPKEEKEMVEQKSLIVGAIKSEVSGLKMNVLNAVVNLLLRVVPTVLASLADGRIDQNEQKEIVSELGSGIATIAGKQLTEEEAGKLFDAAVILINLAK